MNLHVSERLTCTRGLSRPNWKTQVSAGWSTGSRPPTQLAMRGGAKACTVRLCALLPAASQDAQTKISKPSTTGWTAPAKICAEACHLRTLWCVVLLKRLLSIVRFIFRRRFRAAGWMSMSQSITDADRKYVHVTCAITENMLRLNLTVAILRNAFYLASCWLTGGTRQAGRWQATTVKTGPYWHGCLATCRKICLCGVA